MPNVCTKCKGSFHIRKNFLYHDCDKTPPVVINNWYTKGYPTAEGLTDKIKIIHYADFCQAIIEIRGTRKVGLGFTPVGAILESLRNIEKELCKDTK